jgi:hypothetical protein
MRRETFKYLSKRITKNLKQYHPIFQKQAFNPCAPVAAKLLSPGIRGRKQALCGFHLMRRNDCAAVRVHRNPAAAHGHIPILPCPFYFCASVQNPHPAPLDNIIGFQPQVPFYAARTQFCRMEPINIFYQIIHWIPPYFPIELKSGPV